MIIDIICDSPQELFVAVNHLHPFVLQHLSSTLSVPFPSHHHGVFMRACARPFRTRHRTPIWHQVSVDRTFKVHRRLVIAIVIISIQQGLIFDQKMQALQQLEDDYPRSSLFKAIMHVLHPLILGAIEQSKLRSGLFLPLRNLVIPLVQTYVLILAILQVTIKYYL